MYDKIWRGIKTSNSAEGEGFEGVVVRGDEGDRKHRTGLNSSAYFRGGVVGDLFAPDT